MSHKDIIYKILLIFFLLISLPYTISFALERPSKEQIEKYKQDGTLEKRQKDAKDIGNHKVAEEHVKKLHEKLKKAKKKQDNKDTDVTRDLAEYAPPPAWVGLPTTGSVKVLVLLIEFSDFVHEHSSAEVESGIFGVGVESHYPQESLRNYYLRSSYNKLDIAGNVLGWYQTSNPRSDVPETPQGRENLIKEVLTYYDSLGHDFTQYDNNDDGIIDYFAVIWTGPTGEWASFWWGYKTVFIDSSYLIDGKKLSSYSWQWESSRPTGFNPLVLIHETGHALGLPDYYDYDTTVGPKGGVGRLDMMDGNWGDHNCFSKMLLDWITPTFIIAGSSSITLRPSSSERDTVLVMPDYSSDQFGEFYMLQFRDQTGNDTTYPNRGLLIWHVDSTLNKYRTNYEYNNSYTEHKLLRLMEADGLEEIEQNMRADEGDYYLTGMSFGPKTNPNSNRYDGLPSCISVTNLANGENDFSQIVSVTDDCSSPPPPMIKDIIIN